MPLNTLAHVSVRTAMDKMDATRDFYCDVLGLVDGERPPFDFPGHWLYLDKEAVVHLIGHDEKNPGAVMAYMGDKAGTVNSDGTGAFDHVAFFATDLVGVRERIERRGVKYFERTVPMVELHQIFLHDPNGIMVELNFPASEPTQRAAKKTVAAGAV